MAKYKVKVKYALWHFEEYEVDTEELSANSEDGLWNDEDQAQLMEDPIDFCGDALLEDTGDVLDGTWEQTIEEILVLDRIVAAVEGRE